MILTKTKATIYGLVILATGYVAGALMGNPEFDENLLDGDIKKQSIKSKTELNGVLILLFLILFPSKLKK